LQQNTATATAAPPALRTQEVDPTDDRALDQFINITEEYFRENWPEELDRPNWHDRYRELLRARCAADPRRWLWLVWHGDELVGLANFYITGAAGDRIGSIAELYIRAAARNRKLGTKIFALARDAMRGAGATRIKASVQVDELGRVKFWESLGFKIERLHMVMDVE
jgi:GNAT superfamily N-acetyltransferase